MNGSLLLSQLLNGLQLGALLFLLSSGLTLIFGIMNFINLAHGSLYMIGAFLGATAYNASGSFAFAILAAVAGSGLVGVALERLIARPLFFNELASVIWGSRPYFAAVPKGLDGAVSLFGSDYPVYRLMIIGVGALVALGAWFLIQRTRFGMLIRAGASNAPMASVLGANVDLQKTLLFLLGAVLAGVAGALAGPILSVQSGMGEPVLILALVVIVVGGIGSVRGTLVAALLIAMIDTLGRAFLPDMLRAVFDASVANAVGPALASMLIYVLMAVVLAFRPQGLVFSARR
jgi:branched-chain amino acid transport system permease protein